MAFAKAERTQLYLRCALFGPSGSGKTMTALRMAKGIAEKMGVPFAVIDTEARSASKYADRIQFVVDNLGKKTIDHYIASMDEAVKAGYKVLVIDSLSHAWRELTDEVDRITQASISKNSVLSWAKVNPKQKRLIEAILNFPGHIIVTMRSKTEWAIGVGKDGKIAPEKIGLAPEQGKGIEFEFDLLLEMDQKHNAAITKDRTGKYQDETIEKPGEEFGVALYDWLMSGAVVQPKTTTVPVQKSASKPAKTAAVPAKTETSLKEQSVTILKEIGDIITSVENGQEYFSEEERNDARQLIQTTKLNEEGIKELLALKAFLAEELAKRSKKAA
jgi:Ni2+-binding GTPase involved in maturation of urease and hydrogenase